jgi:hypothetical protein
MDCLALVSAGTDRSAGALAITAASPFLVSMLAALACASPQQAPSPARPPPPAPLARSSVAALLLHRGELKLDDDQFRNLKAIDEELASKQASDMQARPPRGAVAAAPPLAGPSGDGGMPLDPMGDPGAGRHGEGHRGAGAGKRAGAAGGVDPDKIWDDNDSEAFYSAEDVLRPDQREAARKIAEDYREALYDARAARIAQQHRP